VKQWQIASRALVRRPAYSLTAISILVLGIGATTALFSIVNTILLKPLPFPRADRLVSLLEASPSKSKKESLIAPARLEDWNRMNRTFESIAGVLLGERNRHQWARAPAARQPARFPAILRCFRGRAAGWAHVLETGGNLWRPWRGGD
jgi:hypothetical protein